MSRLPFALPPGAADCHVHVFPPGFPLVPERAYTPPAAGADALLAVHDALGLARVVVVTPSIHGTDNAATLDALARLGPCRARGIAVLGPGAEPRALDALHAAGVRGIRLNLRQAGAEPRADAGDAVGAGTARLRQAAALLRGRPWHIQLNAPLAMVELLEAEIAALGLPLVLDHFAGAAPLAGPEQPGFAAVLRLLGQGHAWVKLSGAYAALAEPAARRNHAAMARALVGVAPQRLVWGSDWPHPDATPPPGGTAADVTPFHAVDDAALLGLLGEWVPDGALRDRVLVANPARLYDFG